MGNCQQLLRRPNKALTPQCLLKQQMMKTRAATRLAPSSTWPPDPRRHPGFDMRAYVEWNRGHAALATGCVHQTISRGAGSASILPRARRRPQTLTVDTISPGLGIMGHYVNSWLSQGSEPEDAGNFRCLIPDLSAAERRQVQARAGANHFRAGQGRLRIRAVLRVDGNAVRGEMNVPL